MFFANSYLNEKIKTPLVVSVVSSSALWPLSLLTCWMQISVTKSLHCIVMKNVNSPASIGRVFTVRAIFYPRLRSCKKSGGSVFALYKHQPTTSTANTYQGTLSDLNVVRSNYSWLLDWPDMFLKFCTYIMWNLKCTLITYSYMSFFTQRCCYGWRTLNPGLFNPKL